MAGDTDMAEKVALLLWGARTTQLLVEPPWRPAVLWDWVTLTCQVSETAGATTWYRNGQRWGPEGCDHFTVTERNTYACDRPSSGRSPPVTVSDVPVADAIITLEVTLQDTGTHRNTCGVTQSHQGCSGPPGFRVTPVCPPVSPEVAVNVSRALLFLLLLLAVIGGCHWWHHWSGLQEAPGQGPHRCPLALPHLRIHK
ncbi:uncharacterized protein LOC119711494 isoform X2 [Motacilla alba alba]|uniref:uncharacterized protein LOC119711494 isoform X2 n=1 Tax=Motacilla alba alba TaxID=1094192 RepID=UPI0018D4E46C|nr:uncharacterized protein LOC119711494 isoform X2 [Motacilla alba alba]XP_038017747.1 uncharacterized protein LOC119711494 isoform X2 [Motacilla alba alba]XP_038017748.1 uncharacterized protein LOC119711494 isoform X2 [Motacilla alba alba]